MHVGLERTALPGSGARKQLRPPGGGRALAALALERFGSRSHALCDGVQLALEILPHLSEEHDRLPEDRSVRWREAGALERQLGHAAQPGRVGSQPQLGHCLVPQQRVARRGLHRLVAAEQLLEERERLGRPVTVEQRDTFVEAGASEPPRPEEARETLLERAQMRGDGEVAPRRVRVPGMEERHHAPVEVVPPDRGRYPAHQLEQPLPPQPERRLGPKAHCRQQPVHRGEVRPGVGETARVDGVLDQPMERAGVEAVSRCRRVRREQRTEIPLDEDTAARLHPGPFELSGDASRLAGGDSDHTLPARGALAEEGSYVAQAATTEQEPQRGRGEDVQVEARAE